MRITDLRDGTGWIIEPHNQEEQDAVKFFLEALREKYGRSAIYGMRRTEDGERSLAS